MNVKKLGMKAMATGLGLLWTVGWVQNGLAATLQVTANATWTEAKQSEIDASDGIEIASGVTLELDIASGQTLSIAKPIAGAGNVTKWGSGNLELRAANTFDGIFTIGGDGFVYAFSNGAFGSTVGNTVIYEYKYDHGQDLRGSDWKVPGARVVLWGITTSENFSIINQDRSGMFIAQANTTNHLYGAVAVSGNQPTVYAYANSKLYFHGGLSGTMFRPATKTGAEIIIDTEPMAATFWNAMESGGWLVFNVAGNTCSSYTYQQMKTWVDWAFDGNSFNVTQNDANGLKLDLCGHPQRIVSINNGKTSGTSTGQWITSSTGRAYLHVAPTADGTSTIQVKGAAGLFKEGGKTMTTYAAHTSTGDIAVTNGTLAFATGASWAAAATVTVFGTGRLELVDATQVGSPDLLLADTGVLSIPDNATFTANTLTLDGVKMRKGTYAASALNSHLAGTGTQVEVLFDEYTLYVTENEIWDDAEIVKLANYDGVIISAGVTLTWNLANDYTLTTPIGGAGNLVKEGAGNLEIRCANSFSGKFTIGGTGSVYAYDNAAFGSAAGVTEFSQICNSAKGASLYLCGVTVPENIHILGGNTDASLFAAEGTVNYLNGELVCNGSQASVQTLGNATLYLCGGIRSDNTSYSMRPSTQSGSKIIIQNKPLAMKMWNSTKANGQLIFNVASNMCDFTWHPITTWVDWAFDGAWMGVSTHPVGNGLKLDLCGHPQRVSTLDSSLAGTASLMWVTNSGAKAYCYVNETTDGYGNIPFKGAASLCKEGAATMTTYAVHSSTGDVRVVDGTLVFAEGASWLAADSVTVTASGVLQLAHGAVFGSGTDVYLEGENAGIQLADRTAQTVGAIYLDGELGFKGTTYGGTNSAAAFKDARFSGTGVLHTTEGIPCGTLVIFL